MLIPLAIIKRIKFKIATLSYQSVDWSAHVLSSALIPHQPQRSIRSFNQNLSVQRCNSSFGQRSYSCCAPKIWNEIPLSVRQSPSLNSFKRNLKTHYFANNWPPGDCLQRLWFAIHDTVRSTNCCEWMNTSMATILTLWPWNLGQGSLKAMFLLAFHSNYGAIFIVCEI